MSFLLGIIVGFCVTYLLLNYVSKGSKNISDNDNINIVENVKNVSHLKGRKINIKVDTTKELVDGFDNYAWESLNKELSHSEKLINEISNKIPDDVVDENISKTLVESNNLIELIKKELSNLENNKESMKEEKLSETMRESNNLLAELKKELLALDKNVEKVKEDKLSKTMQESNDLLQKIREELMKNENVEKIEF